MVKHRKAKIQKEVKSQVKGQNTGITIAVYMAKNIQVGKTSQGYSACVCFI